MMSSNGGSDNGAMKKRRKPQRLSLVRFEAPWLSPKQRRAYPFKRRGTYLFVGEVANMPGRCVVLDWKANRTYLGYHTENFVQLSEDET
jgi:hypothetical protein